VLECFRAERQCEHRRRRRAIEHLALVAVEAEAVPLRNTVLIPRLGSAFDDGSQPVDPAANAALAIVLDDLAWWAMALADARAQGELPPSAVRQAAATSA